MDLRLTHIIISTNPSKSPHLLDKKLSETMPSYRTKTISHMESANIFDTYPHAPIEAFFIGWAILEGTTMLRKGVFGGDLIDATLVTLPS